MNNLEIRTMNRDQMGIAVDWAAAEGWNPGLDDAEAFFSADNGGFLMAFQDNEPAACISAVRYGEGYGFIGFYICRPDLRGRGIGMQVWRAGMERLDGRIIGLDGVVDQQENYRKSGFVLAHNNIRFSGALSISPQPDAAVRQASAQDIETILDYDQLFFADNRRAFTERWLLGAPTRHGLLLGDGRKVRGFGVIRQCREGYKVGPLFADDADIAERLFKQLCAQAGSAQIFLDVPAKNPQAVEMANFYGMVEVFETARMYKGKAPDISIDRTFGITTFELG